MDPLSEKIVRAGLERLAVLQVEETRISEEIKMLIQSIKESCNHPTEMIVEGDYYPSNTFSYAQPPFRVCRLCGYSEPDWNCGYFRLDPDNCNVPQMSRDEAWKFIRGGLMSQEEKNKLFLERWKKEEEKRRQVVTEDADNLV